MNEPPEARMAALDPIYRIECEEAAVYAWRVTWSDGASEQVHAHSIEIDREHGTIVFLWYYIGPHRIINLAHVREVAAVDS